MKRRDFLKITGAGFAASALSGCVEMKNTFSSHKQAHRPPNLVFVFPDQMRGSAMGFLNKEPVITPRLDRFASESLVLTQAVSNYPLCSPFRAMFMSGKYPVKNRITNNCNSRSAPYDCELRQDERCWSDILKDNGYSLGYIGKWHLDSPKTPYVDCSNNKGRVAWNEWCPPERRHGFDFWYAYGTYDQHLHPMYWKTEAGRDEFHYVDQWGPQHEADKAIQYINNENNQYRDPDKPFALVVSMNPPHHPYKQVPQKYVDLYDDLETDELFSRPNLPPRGTKMNNLFRYNIRYYYAMITGVDEQFGRILDALKQQGLENDTIVVFASDHGNCMGIHNQTAKNNRFEESMRIPFIVRWPDRIKARRDDLLFSGLDIYPTLLGLMGFESDIPHDTDGISYTDLMLTGRSERPKWQWYMWTPYGSRDTGKRGIRNPQYTFVINKLPGRENEIFLHDNQNDPYQLKNIAAENPDLVRQLTKELNTILKKYNDPWLKS